MVLFSNASSNFRRGGITSRGGGNTEEILNNEAPPTSTNQKTRWWNRLGNWIGDHSEGIGKVIGGGATLAATAADIGLKAFGGDPFVGKLVSNIKNEVGDSYANDSSKWGKFMKGLTNKRINKNTAETVKIWDDPNLSTNERLAKITDSIFANKDLNKGSKAIQSNGHVPQGYPASSVQTVAGPKAVADLRAVAGPKTGALNTKLFYINPSVGGRNYNQFSEAVQREWERYRKGQMNQNELTDRMKRKAWKKWMKKKKGKKGKKDKDEKKKSKNT